MLLDLFVTVVDIYTTNSGTYNVPEAWYVGTYPTCIWLFERETRYYIMLYIMSITVQVPLVNNLFFILKYNVKYFVNIIFFFIGCICYDLVFMLITYIIKFIYYNTFFLFLCITYSKYLIRSLFTSCYM